MMNKKILVGIAIVLVIAFAGYGLSKSVNNSNAELSELSLANVEALAQNENGGDNSWYLWSIQGMTKDEYPEEKPCTESISALGVWTVEWEGRRIICYDGGQNCSTQIRSE